LKIEIVNENKFIKQFLLLQGDSKDILKQIPDNFVNTVVTSPPYWQLRDYFADDQLGQEATPEEYVENLVNILREVKRVLRKDGSLWLNLGDGYNNNSGFERTTDWKRKGRKGGSSDKKSFKHKSIKTKDLVGIPWSVAKALQEPYYTGYIKKEIDRVWLASMIDGEGSISGFTHDRKDGGGIRRGINIHITNSNMDLLDECFRIWPKAKKQHMKNGENHHGEMEIFRWIPNGVKDKSMLMAEIYPNLIAKKKQALLAWNFLQISKDARGKKQTDENNQRCKWIVENLSKLNHQEHVDIPKWIKEPPLLEETGWYLRCDIIWEKTNPMPDGVKDRPTRGHEYVFLLTKSPKYYYDYYRVLEDTEKQPEQIQGFGANEQHGTYRMDQKRTFEHYGKRNKRSVWRTSVSTFKGKHFATYPSKLIDPMIAASTSEKGCCVECGTPWHRKFEKEKIKSKEVATGESVYDMDSNYVKGKESNSKKGYILKLVDNGFEKGCKCDTDEVKPGVVLDPFNGSGTTGKVAFKYDQKYIGIDTNKEYLDIARKNIAGNYGYVFVEAIDLRSFLND